MSYPAGSGEGLLENVRIFPMPSFGRLQGSTLLEVFHEGQRKFPIREVWDPALRISSKIVEYVCAIGADLPTEVRQESVLLLKRYVWAASSGAAAPRKRRRLQLLALMSVHLAMKHWSHVGIPEQKLHWLSRNTFTKEDFIEAEVDLMMTLGCCVHWEGALVAEWTSLLLFLSGPLLASSVESSILGGVVAHLADLLVFEDALMSSNWPSELSAAMLHAAVMLSTKRFQRHAFTSRIDHLCGAREEKVVQLSERILMLAVGARCADVIIEGSGVTAEDSDVAESSDEELEPDSALATPGGVASLTKSVRHCVRVGKVGRGGARRARPVTPSAVRAPVKRPRK